MELYEHLLIRYRNSIKYIDDYDIKGIILFNEPVEQIKRMFIKFKFSKYSLVDGEYKINIITFVKYALKRGYDWKLFGQPEWKAIKPKKKKKFMKPRKLK